MQTITALHRRATDAVLSVVSRVREDDLDRPTPCVGWDLRTLLAHMVGQDRGFAAAALADVSAEAFEPGEVEAHAAAAEVVVAAFAAAPPDREVLLPEFGARFPLRTVVGFHLVDTLVHGWDVAVSLGGNVWYDDDLVAAVLELAEAIPGGDLRTAPGAPFGPIRDEARSATGWARTLALLGRDPRWTAPVAVR